MSEKKVQVLKITKADGTVHTAPLSNKAFLTAYNNRLRPDQKMKLEEISEADAENLDYLDPSYVSAGEAQSKLAEKEKENADLKEKLAELQAKFNADPESQKFAQNIGAGKPATTTDKTSDHIEDNKVFTAVETIAQIKDVTSLDELQKYASDERATVIAAYEKKLAELQEAE